MARILRLFAFTFLAAASLLAQSPETKSFRLLAINFKGLHEFKADEVIAASGLKVGGMVVTGEFQTAANKLVATGAFSGVNFSYAGERGGYVLEFRMEEAEKYYPLSFENFVWTSDDELLKYLEARVPLFHGRTAEGGEMVRSILDTLTLWLGEHKVNGQAAYRLESDLKQQTVTAIAVYVDGVRMPVRSVTLENAPNLTPKERDHLAKSLIGNDYERSVANSVVSLSMEPIYQRKGYLRAKASQPALKILSNNPEQVEIALTYTIEEGRQYKVSGLRWAGNTSLATAELQKTLKIGLGSVADLIELRDDIYAAQKLYGRLGMLRAQVEPKLTYDDAADTVSLELDVTEGSVFTMGSLEITGLNPQETEEMRAKWKMKFGDHYNSDYLTQFLRETVSITQGRRAKIEQSEAPGNVVHLKLQFD